MDLLLVRHGLAGKADPSLWPDDDLRPLTAKGRKAFKAAAKGLKRAGPLPSLILASPALRTRETAALLAKALGLGARALKRAIERQLTAPIAIRLASLTPDVPTLVSIYTSGEGIAPHVQPLINVQSTSARLVTADTASILDRVEAYVNDVEAATGGAESGSVRVSTDALSAEDFRYFAVREQIQRIDRLLRQIDQSNSRPSHITRRTPRVRAPRRIRTLGEAAEEYRDLLLRGDARALMPAMLERARLTGDEPVDQLNELLDECAMLEAIRKEGSDRVLLALRPLGGREHDMVRRLTDAYLHLFNRQQGFVATPLQGAEPECAWILLEMPGSAEP